MSSFRLSEQRTFSSLPISSRLPTLLGVVVSLEPSASMSGHKSNLCLPLRRLLFPWISRQQVHSSEHPDHFFPKRRKVEPPTGMAVRGPAMSHTVNVIWEFNGRSQYRIGNVIHSFHLQKLALAYRDKLNRYLRIILLERLV